MKKQLKAMLLVAVTGAAASTAQAAIYNGDLLIGFTAQSGNDFIYDLGSASSLVNGQTWDFSAFLAGFNLNTVSWGVIGDKSGSPRVAWTTTGGTIPATLSGNADWATLDTPTKSIYSNFGTAGAGQSLSISANDDNSWNQQTINGALNTQYHNAYGDPNVTGLGADSFFTVAANGADPVQLGSFSLGANGTLSYSTLQVPEPSSFALLAGGVLALAFRNKLRK